MHDITTSLIKEVRERTNAGIMECKKALIETHGNIELAIDNIRRLGRIKISKRANRTAVEGIIFTKIAQYGLIIEINCETDFTAKDNNLKVFGDNIIKVALNEHITDIKILKDKFESECSLLVTKFGENINIRRLGVLEGNILGSYLHGTRIGVIVSFDYADEELIKHIAMHIAASKPKYINASNIPINTLMHERKIQLDTAIQSGKSFKIAEKIVEGRMRKFISEVSLTDQYFILDPNKTVGQILSEYNTKINNFIRFEVGECI